MSLLLSKYASYLLILLLALVVSSYSAHVESQNTCVSYQDVLTFLESAALDYFPNKEENATELFPMSPCNGVVIEEATIDELQEAMEEGSLTSVELLWCYLERIHQIEEYVKYVYHDDDDINDCPFIEYASRG